MSPYYQGIRDRVGSSLILMPSVAAIIHNPDGALLLQQKSDGSWSLPAGAIEPGESPQQALAREVLEESGHSFTSSDLVGIFGGEEFRHTYPNGDQVEYVVALYRCAGIQKITDELDDETAALQFFPRSNFPGLALPYPIETLYQNDG